MQTTLVDVQSLFQLRSADAGWYSENIYCHDCKVYFDDEPQWLGNGHYLAFCGFCYKSEMFSNADLLSMKCEDDHYPLVKQLVKYHFDNRIEIVISSVYNGFIVDGHHRLAAAVELGIKLVIIDNREEPILDTVDQWVSRSPAFA